MIYTESLTKQQALRYLARIGITEKPKPNLNGLHELLVAHLSSIPFDSIDVWATGCVPSLALQDLYDKIVVSSGVAIALNRTRCSVLR